MVLNGHPLALKVGAERRQPALGAALGRQLRLELRLELRLGFDGILIEQDTEVRNFCWPNLGVMGMKRAGEGRGAIEVGGLEEADARGQTYERATARAERHVREE